MSVSSTACHRRRAASAFGPVPPAALVLLGVVALCVVCALPGRAGATAVGPYEVEGPRASYDWTGSTLSVTGEGVVIAGMADSPDPAEPRSVTVASGVAGVGIGSGVLIDELSVGRITRFTVSGEGNAVASWDSLHGDAVAGDGALAVGTATGDIDVHDSATVRIDGAAQGAGVWERATLVIGPDASFKRSITALGGVLDLSQVQIGQPVSAAGVSVGNPGATLAVAAPFGATGLGQLLSYGNLIVLDATPVYEDGEAVGTLQEDGSFLITAVRTVTFTGFGGAVLAQEAVPLFGAATAPEAPAPEGYRFVGWDAPFDHVTADETVGALFERVPDPAPAPPPESGGGDAPERGTAASPAASRPPSARHRLAATGDGLAADVAAAAGAALLAVASTALAVRRRKR